MKLRLLMLLLILSLSLVLSACVSNPTIIVYAVDDRIGSANPNCDAATKFNTLAQAVNCSKTRTEDIIKIVVQCSQSGVPYCDYQLPSSTRFERNQNGKRVELIGEPTLMPRIKHQYEPSSNKRSIFVEDNWTIRGITFDGDYGHSDPAKKGALIVLGGNNITFTHNEVLNTPYSCIFIGDPLAPNAPNRIQTSNVEVSHNLIHDCYEHAGVIDRFGVYTYDTTDIRVAYNEFWRISGDAFQNLNELPTNGGTTGVASHTHIIGNKMWSACYQHAGSPLALGENAIDIKRSGIDLIIRDNIIWGYRQSNDKNQHCHGTGLGGDPGYAIVVHGQFEKQTGTTTSPCSGADLPCALIEGNQISFSQGGIAIGDDISPPPFGPTRGVIVRGNYITDMRGIRDGTSTGKPNRRGHGMSLLTQGQSTDYNDIYRNTLVNIFGNSFSTSSGATGFRVRNNLIAYTAPQADASGTPACNQPVASTGGPSFANNWWYNALVPPAPDNRSGPVYFIANSQIVPPSCGREMYQWKDPHAVDTASPWDYRLTETGIPVPVQDGADQAFGERHSDMMGYCDNGYGIGADEYCSYNLKIHLNDAPSGSQRPGRAEVYTGGDEWWLSQDIGVHDKSMPYATPTPNSRIDDMELDLFNSWPTFSRTPANSYEIVLRVRAGGALAVPEPIGVRVWGGLLTPADNLGEAFPTGFELVVSTTVEFHGVTSGIMANGRNWRKLAGNNNVHIFGFDWDVPGARNPKFADPKGNNLERYALRAEISAAEDRRPPLNTRVYYSNNLAQHNIYVQRAEVTTDDYLLP